MSELWGNETRKAIDNFPVSGTAPSPSRWRAGSAGSRPLQRA